MPLSDLQKFNNTITRVAYISVHLSWGNKKPMDEAAMMAKHCCLVMALYLEVKDAAIMSNAVVAGVVAAVQMFYDQDGSPRDNPVKLIRKFN